MRLPVALELLEHLATVNIPQPDRLVVRPTDELRWIRVVELDATDPTAVAFQGVEAFSGRPQLDLVVSRSAAADRLRAIPRTGLRHCS